MFSRAWSVAQASRASDYSPTLARRSIGMVVAPYGPSVNHDGVHNDEPQGRRDHRAQRPGRNSAQRTQQADRRCNSHTHRARPRSAIARKAKDRRYESGRADRRRRPAAGRSAARLVRFCLSARRDVRSQSSPRYLNTPRIISGCASNPAIKTLASINTARQGQCEN